MKRVIKKFTDGKLDGRYLVYLDEQLIERGKYELGKKERLWVRYYKNGNIKSERYYSNDKLSDFYNFYYPTGEIFVTGEFSDNKRVGEWRFYDKNKKIKINSEFIEISYQEQLKSKADAFASLFHQLTEVFKE